MKTTEGEAVLKTNEGLPNNNEAVAGPSGVTSQNSSIGTIDKPTVSSAVEGNVVSFEELLLETVKQVPEEKGKRRKRVADGAEVITSMEAIRRGQTMIEKGSKKKSKQNRKTPGQKKKKVSSDSEDTDISIASSRSNTPDMTDVLHEIIEDEELESNDEEFSSSILEVGKWVLVKFTTKRTCKHYIGKIILKNKVDSSLVKFTRKVGSTFTWPELEDICEVSDDDIEMTLPDPKVGRRGELAFSVSFANFNIN